MPTQQFFSYIMAEQVNFQWDDDEVRFVLDQNAELEQVNFQWNDDEVRFVLDQHEVNFQWDGDEVRFILDQHGLIFNEMMMRSALF